jgi:hypothetical protein
VCVLKIVSKQDQACDAVCENKGCGKDRREIKQGEGCDRARAGAKYHHPLISLCKRFAVRMPPHIILDTPEAVRPKRELSYRIACFCM